MLDKFNNFNNYAIKLITSRTALLPIESFFHEIQYKMMKTLETLSNVDFILGEEVVDRFSYHFFYVAC